MEFPVFDLHCDTALALLGPSLRECGSLKTNDKHIALVLPVLQPQSLTNVKFHLLIFLNGKWQLFCGKLIKITN